MKSRAFHMTNCVTFALEYNIVASDGELATTEAISEPAGYVQLHDIYNDAVLHVDCILRALQYKQGFFLVTSFPGNYVVGRTIANYNNYPASARTALYVRMKASNTPYQ